jgi:hypothetical protein
MEELFWMAKPMEKSGAFFLFLKIHLGPWGASTMGI